MFDDEVVGLGGLVQLELVLEAAAAAGKDRDAQGGRLLSWGLLAGDDLGDAFGGSVGYAEGCHDANIGRGESELKAWRVRDISGLVNLSMLW